MTVLVVGASGATGLHLVEELLERGERVKIIVRSTEKFSERVMNHSCLSVIRASVLDLSDTEMAEHVRDCSAVASCLGHNLSFKGIFASPRRLVTDTARRLCNAIKANKANEAVKFVLMNTAGNSNRDLEEKISFGQKCVIGLLRLLLPPHVDNENAADFLRTQLGQKDEAIEWSVVRPDGLIDETESTEITVHSSPTRSAIFDAGKTSRVNVGRFMADLISKAKTWNEWKGKMPVIYNKEPTLQKDA
jgi:NAD(P)-dependent dehydrogenase (short-subunit alcohol dehydrogenase family)